MVIGNKEIVNVLNDFKLILYLNYSYLSYAIFNTRNNCFEKIKTHPLIGESNMNSDELTRIINTDTNLQQQYQHTLCTIESNSSTLIPEPLFEEKNITNYLDETDNDNLAYKYIKQNFEDCFTIFTIKKNILHLLETQFHHIKIKSASSVLIDYASTLNQDNHNTILTEVKEKSFHIVFHEKGKLKFYNQFNFETINDFIYYFMNCIQILRIDTKETNTMVVSELHKEHTLFQKLAKQIKIIFLKKPNIFLYSNNLINSPSHMNHHLFSQLICE